MMVPDPVRTLRIPLIICFSLALGPISSTCIPAFDFLFVDWPEWRVVKAGEKVELTCATNLPSDSIKWYHNHRPVPAVKKPKFLSLAKNESSLVIRVSKDRNIYQRQEGIYQCVASVGPVSIISLPGRIEVAFLEKFPPSVATYRNIRVPKDGSIIVPCRKPKSLPEAQIIFYKDGEALVTDNSNKYFTMDVGDLVILRADESIQGIYSCLAYNQLLKKTVRMNSSMEIVLEPIEGKESFNLPFNFIYKNQSRVAKGDVIMLLCVQHGHERPSYEWWLMNSSSSNMERISNQRDALMRVKVTENGIYACHVRSLTGATSSNISIFIQEPPFIKVAPQNVSLHEGESARLECLFGGSPLPTISWVFNGKFLGGRNFLTINNEISLKNVSKMQAGIYQCFAFNPFGAAYGTSLVQVTPKTISLPHYNDLINEIKNGRKNHRRKRIKHKKDRRMKQNRIKDKEIIPSKPIVTKLTDESVLVAWNANDEQSPNDSKILFYKVQFKTISRHRRQKTKWRTVAETIVPPATTCEVTGLVVNYYYRFRVAAVYMSNDHKFGPPSEKFFLEKFSRLQRPPNSPRIMSVEGCDNNSIGITWSYESEVYTEGFIVNYRRTGILEDYKKVVLLGDMRRGYVVENLKKDTPYDFKLSSFNMAGMSPYSARKTLLPKNFRGYPSVGVVTSTTIPVVMSHQEILSATHLAFGLGIGLMVLLLIVMVSFVFHRYKKRRINSAEKDASNCEKDKSHYLDEEGQDSPFINRTTKCSTNCTETLKLEDH